MDYQEKTLQLDIAVRMPNWIGDVVMATPLLYDIKKRYPHAKTTVICASPQCQILDNNPNIDCIISFKKPKWWNFAAHYQVIKKIRRKQYNIYYSTPSSFTSRVYAACMRSPVTVGYDTTPLLFPFTRAISRERLWKEHIVDSYKRLLSDIISVTSPKIYVDSSIQLPKEINSGKKYIVVHPFAAYGGAKCWPLHHFKELILQLREKWPDVAVIVVGGKGTAQQAATIVPKSDKDVVSLCEKTTLKELVKVISCASIMITNDSGPLHMASALGVYTIGLFGSTSPSASRPYTHGKPLSFDVPCSPCFKRECPIDFPCMENLEVSTVIREVKSYFN